MQKSISTQHRTQIEVAGTDSGIPSDAKELLFWGVLCNSPSFLNLEFCLGLHAPVSKTVLYIQLLGEVLLDVHSSDSFILNSSIQMQQKEHLYVAIPASNLPIARSSMPFSM